jgi:rubrerythrin
MTTFAEQVERSPFVRVRRTGEADPPMLFECKLCGKLFDSREEHPSCPECDANDVERVG